MLPFGGVCSDQAVVKLVQIVFEISDVHWPRSGQLDNICPLCDVRLKIAYGRKLFRPQLAFN
jgi:hypothetical protein